MASGVVSKNLFDLLGNDADEDGQPTAPVVPVEKSTQRTGKRVGGDEKATKEPPSGPRGGGRGGRGGRRENYSGNEQAFQDRGAGRSANQGKHTDDGTQRSYRNTDRVGDGRRGGSEGRGRGRGRGGRGGGYPFDRHSNTAQTDSEKQIEKGWGDSTAVGELKDENAGEQLAWEEAKEDANAGEWDTPVNAEGETFTGESAAQPEPEPEDKSQSYADYMAEQAKKREALGTSLQARKANEGASKKLPEGKALERAGGEDYFIGGGGKTKRERAQKDKNTLVLDYDIQPRERDSPRGGRGGRGRGRGEGGFRGEGRGRGGRGRGDFRGDFRGGRGGRGGASPNFTDESAFPSLSGGK